MAIANPLQPFLWGSGGEQMTPQQVARQREIAEALMGSVGDTSPVDHWLQGVPRITDAIGMNMREGLANDQETAGRNAFQERFSSIFGGGGDPVAAALSGGSGASGGSALDAVNRTAAVPSGERAGYIRQGLLSRGLPDHVADAFLLNFQDESGLNPGINEAKPLVPGSRGGFGLYQLTGPRRTAYESFANQRGVDPSDIDAQLDWLMHELQGPESKAAQSILGAPDMNSAAVAIVNDFLRPAPEHRQSRASAYMAAQPRTQVASLDPGAGMEVPSTRTPDASANAVPWGSPGAVVDPSMLMDVPGVTDGQQPANGLPPNAAPGTMAQGADGQTYMYAETTGMAGATGANGWIPYSGGGAGEQSSPMQTAQAAPAPTQGAPATVQPSMLAPPPAYTPQYDIGSLIGLASDPWANDSERSIINALMGQEMQQQAQANDPLRQLEIQRAQLELDAMMNPPEPFRPVPMSPQEMAAWGIPEGSGSWTIGENGMPEQIFEAPAAPAPPNSVQEYEYYVQQAQAAGEQPVPYIEWDTARKAAGATNISNVVGGGEAGPKLGSLSTDYGYVHDPETGQPVIDPETGLAKAAPVPGSPAERAIADEAARAGSLQDDQAAYARTVTQDLGVAASYLDEIPEWAQGDGIMASNLRAQRANIAGTPEYNMRRFTESALDNVVLDTINRMRQGSAAGATGFGNMNQQQVEIIRGVLGRWDPALPLKDQRYIFDRLNNFYMDVQFGTPTERAGAVRDGRMTQEENDAIEQFYATETRDIRGRDMEGGETQAPPNQSQPNPDVVDFSDYF